MRLLAFRFFLLRIDRRFGGIFDFERRGLPFQPDRKQKFKPVLNCGVQLKKNKKPRLLQSLEIQTAFDLKIDRFALLINAKNCMHWFPSGF